MVWVEGKPLKILLFKKIALTPSEYARIRNSRYGGKHSGYLNKPLRKSQLMPSYITNERELAEWLYENYGVGDWYALTWDKRKCKDGKTRVCLKKKKIFRIIIITGFNEGFSDVTFKVITTRGLSHYGFWKGRAK